MKKILSFLVIVIIALACTDLEEDVLDEAMGQDIMNGESVGDGLLAPVYSRMHWTMNSGTDYLAIQEVSSDEGILPYRGGQDWLDGGKYLELHQHTWTATHATIYGSWLCFTEGSSRALLAINQLSDINPKLYSTYISEAFGMNAFYLTYMLDAFGLVLKKAPEDFGKGEKTTSVLKTDEAFDYIISMLDLAEPNLKTTREVGSGRFSKGTAWALKARLYLNKAVYIDPYATTHTFSDEDMDTVIACCNRVINSGQYELEVEDYFKMFNVDNYNHPEIIYAMDASLEANGLSRFMWIVNSRGVYAGPVFENRDADGTDGIAITSEFYDTWEGNHDDPRFYKEYLPQKDTAIADADYSLCRGILRGQRYGIVINDDETDFKRDDDGNLIIEALIEQRMGVPLIYTREIDLEGGENSKQESGYRANKYEYDPETDTKNNGRVDIPLLRLGDVYLMKAEALLRKGETSAARNVVNELRTARGAQPIDNLDLDQMLKERGYEMYFEQIRRTDQIRFDKFEDTWTSKTNNDITRRVFPIPNDAIQANPELLQQNEGY